MGSKCPPEIIRKILLHFHRVDLLNSRLVSQSWNKESIRALSKSEYLLDLNETNIGEYIEFSKQSYDSPLLIIPFSLTLTFDIAQASESSASATEKFGEILSKVDTLTALFGPECVRDLRLNINTNAQEFIPLALKLLGKINNGLENLGIWINTPLTGTGDDFFKNCPDLILSKVKNLYMWSKENPNTTFWPILATKCPNVVEVQMLGFPRNLLDQNWPVNLSLTKIRHLVCTGLLPLLLISSKIRQTSSLSNLTWLQIGIRANFTSCDLDVLYLRGMLDHISTTLVTLDFLFYGPITGIYEDSVVIPCTWFNRLKNLRLRTYTCTKGTDINYPTLKIQPLAFPALELIKLPYCMKVEVLNTDGVMDNPFPKVKDLELCVREDLGLTPTEPYKNHMEELQNIFKNVSKVSIANSDSNCTYKNGQNGGGRIKYVLEGISQSAGATKITQLTLEDCHENYLGMILNQICDPPPRIVVENLPRNYLLDGALKKILQKFTGGIDFIVIEQKKQDGTVVVQQCTQNLEANFNMRNLKKIRLVLNSYNRSVWNSCFLPSSDDFSSTKNLMDTPRELYLKTLVRNFPHLEEIQVSSFLFGRDMKVRTELLQKISNECPNIVIDVI